MSEIREALEAAYEVLRLQCHGINNTADHAAALDKARAALGSSPPPPVAGREEATEVEWGVEFLRDEGIWRWGGPFDPEANFEVYAKRLLETGIARRFRLVRRTVTTVTEVVAEWGVGED